MVQLVKSRLLEEGGFPLHGFTDRRGGVSREGFSSLNLSYDVGDNPAAVKENLDLLASSLDLDVPLFRVAQIHGSRIVSADDFDPSRANGLAGPPTVEADGIISNSGEMMLGIQTADCAAVLLADPETRTVAAVHAGWRGTAKGIIRKAVRAMSASGANPARMLAAIGPAICASCYEVGEDVARHFPESCDPIKGKSDKYLLDLPLAIEVSLIGAGLSDTGIDAVDRCTFCEKESFFSYRRDGRATGRMLGMISAGFPAS